MKINSENLNINLRHLRALHAVATQGSFARAAEELGVVASALTETIRQLEDNLGAALFDRSQRPPAATPFALELLQDTAPLLDGLDRAISRAKRSADLGAGHLSVGAAPSAISDLVGPALAKFRAAYPKIRCSLHDDVAETLAEKVADGRLDLAVAGHARPRHDLKQTCLARDRFGLACASHHALAGSAAGVTLAQINPDEVISLSAHTGTWQLLAACPQISEALRSGGLDAHSTVAQLCMIRAGLGVGLMPENAVMLFGDPSIRFVPITDLELWRSLYLLEPARRPGSHIAARFTQFLQKQNLRSLGLASNAR